MIHQGLDSLNSALQAHAEAEVTGEEIAYTPPSEAKFAQAVAKDMAREMLPPPQTLGLILALMAASLLIGLWLGRRGRH
jgi:hypothetical protein